MQWVSAAWPKREADHSFHLVLKLRMCDALEKDLHIIFQSHTTKCFIIINTVTIIIMQLLTV